MTTTCYYKLYVFSRKTSFSSQAVQSGHAIAEFVKQAPNHPWFHGPLVLLDFDGSEEDFRGLLSELSVDRSIEHIAPWVERRELTAFAVVVPSHGRDTRFSEYKLLR